MGGGGRLTSKAPDCNTHINVLVGTAAEAVHIITDNYVIGPLASMYSACAQGYFRAGHCYAQIAVLAMKILTVCHPSEVCTVTKRNNLLPT